MSITEYYNPVNRGHQRMDAFDSSSSLLTVGTHRWSPSVDSNPLLSLSRSKSDMDMSTLPRSRATSHSSYVLSTSRSESFPRPKEEKQGGMKSLISKSSRLLHKRRTSSKTKSIDLQNNNSSFDIQTHSRNIKEQVAGLDFACRPLISEPYNFRHLTHGGPAQAKALQTTDRDQLVTEFSVIRASQAPKPELKGIKADDIVTQHINTVSQPVSRSSSPTSVYSSNVLRSSKSVGCFTRLASNSFSSPFPPMSPPRRSSRQFQSGLGLDILESRTYNDAGSSSPTYSINQDLLAPTQEIAQAITTPDSSAQLFMTHQRTPSSAALADVPEEEEDIARNARAESRPRDLRHAKSFPARIVTYENNEQPQFIGPQIGEEDKPARSSGGLSSELSQSDWEDDIDYCYEHAMEAASFAWGDDDIWAREITSDDNLSMQNTSPYFQTSFNATENGSAASSSVSVPGIVTPLEGAGNRDSFATSHSLLFPAGPSSVLDQFDNTESLESMNTGCIKPKVPLAPTIITEYSPRNSGSMTFEWSPQSSSVSRKTSITIDSEHRRSTSGGNLPDILPYGMTQRSKSTAASFHRSKSSENVMPKPLNLTLPPNLPVASRSRSNSEAVGKFLDLSMIGAPSTGASYRSRAGSVASIRPRTSYSLFPTTSMVVPPR